VVGGIGDESQSKLGKKNSFQRGRFSTGGEVEERRKEMVNGSRQSVT